MRNYPALFTSLSILSLLVAGCGNSGSSGTTGESGTTGSSTTTTTTPESGGKRPTPTAAPVKADGETIKLGVVASLTGDLLPWGEDSKRGAEMAVEEANSAGGVGGKKIELLVEDSGSDSKQAPTVTDRLIKKGVLGIVGEVASGITKQMALTAFPAGIPVIAVGATNPEITDTGSNVFRVCYTDNFQGPVMAKFAFEELGLKKIAIMTDTEQPYSTFLSKSFREYFVKLGGEIVDEQNYKSKDTQFTAQLTVLKQKAPDGLFLSGYFTEVGLIARQAKEQGLNVKLLGGDGWDSKELTSTGGEGILGGYFCNHYNSKEDRPEIKDFLSKWTAKYGSEPGTTMGALGYDAMKLMIDALKRASSLDSKALTDAIENTENFASVSGEITLKGMGGNPKKRALVVEVTKEGQVFRKAYEYFE